MEVIKYIADFWFHISYVLDWIAGYAGDIPFVGSALETNFRALANYFYSENLWTKEAAEDCLYTKTYRLGYWIQDIADEAGKILSLDTVWSYILSYVPNLLDISDWFYSWFTYVTFTIDTWWSATQEKVLTWVQGAKDFTTTLFNQVNNALAALQGSWDSFKGNILPISEVLSWWGNWSGNVLSFINTWWTSTMGDIQSLVNSSFIEREPFWAGWQYWRDKVIEFFTDPLEFLWARFTEWFLGPEE